MDLSDFAWREVLLVALALAGVYLAVALLGLARLRRGRTPQPAWPVTAAPKDAPAPAIEPTFGAGFAEPLPKAGFAASELVAIDVSPAPASAAPGGATVSFAEQLSVTQLEAEVRQLRADLATLREELAELKSARRVSPLYADAAALAQRGYDAHGVAAECGISVAEAELVLAMSRDGADFDKELEEVSDGGFRRPVAANAAGR